MSWATRHIEKLRAGESVQFRPHGNSMTPRIKSGQLCTVEPANVGDVRQGDVVLCKVNGKQYLHLVRAVGEKQVQIANIHGRINGWTSQVYGRLVQVEP